MNPIVWSERALDHLAEIYVTLPADERVGIVRAVREVEHHLGVHGQYAGESRTENHRVYFHSLLVISFTVHPQQPIEIVQVRHNRRRPQS